MKVGDYVRFKTLSREIKIGKVIDIIAPDKNSMKKYCVYDLDNNEATVDDYIIKSSSNIIDLIEVGDYINGHKIIKISEDFANRKMLIYGYDNGERQVAITIYEDEIKSIVTKEQFESMEYKVGDK